MPQTLARVELHHPSPSSIVPASAYEALHKAMEKVGYYRTVTLNGGTVFQLPNGEYFSVQFTTPEDAMTAARTAAAQTGYAFTIALNTSESGSRFVGPVKS